MSSMSSPALTIRSLAARAVAAPLARPLRTASGDVPVSPLLLIDVQSEEGPAGRGTCVARGGIRDGRRRHASLH